MKPRTKKSSESEEVMRFFARILYVRFNSPDDGEADRADEAWETAVREYRTHLEALRDQMPSQVRKLAGLCLHDAELLACDETIEPIFPLPSEPFPHWSGFAILSVQQGDEVVSLIYVLWDRLRRHPPTEPWPFSKRPTHWLYDEVDVAPIQPGMFLHRVLSSDGAVVEVPFVSILIHSVPLREGRASGAPRQTA
jgi:hypothetical protein